MGEDGSGDAIRLIAQETEQTAWEKRHQADKAAVDDVEAGKDHRRNAIDIGAAYFWSDRLGLCSNR